MQTSLPRRLAWSVRARVIAAVVALTGVALTISGLIVHSHSQALITQRVSADLVRAQDELGKLAREGIDPATGRRFASAEPLLKVAVQRSVLAPSEGVFAVVDGAIRWTAQPAVTFRPEKDPEFVSAVLPLAGSDTATQGTIRTAQRTYHYLVVPIVFSSGTPGGALVRAVDVGAEESVFDEVWRSYALVAVGSLLLVGLLSWLLVGRLLEPISWMRRTAERITDTAMDERIPVRGNDDLSALGVTVNHMLDRVEGAVGAQRELLDDVGHELRTPLTIVRGHLELLDPNDAEDVAATRSLLLDETDRMRRLVDDLLTLAKAEQPEFVQPVVTDIARLTDETLAKATALGSRHWVLDNLADCEVALDEQRVAQAWLQLAANAVRYSGEGSEIGMGSTLAEGELWLSVRDEGIGVDTDDLDRITGRFRRGGLSSDRSGLGLGLSIVAAIASAHHGRVDIESEVGHGSTFSIVIPLNDLPKSKQSTQRPIPQRGEE